MKKFYFVLLGLLIGINVNAAWDYTSKKNYTGNFETTTSWNDENAPSVDGNVSRKMTIEGFITRNGNLNPVHVVVNGTFVVNGDYLNNQSDGLEIGQAAKVEIFGDLIGSAAILIAKDATLIVHGNMTSTGSEIKSNGNIIVEGNFSTSSSTHVQNKGNLVVGGDFSHLGGDLKGQSNNIYILNPDANVTHPGWGIISNGDFGTLEDFVIDESGSNLGNIVDEVGMLNPVVEWTGTMNADWSTAGNWKNNKVPNYNTSVKVTASISAPVINDNAVCKDLTIEAGAEVVVNPGTSLDIANSFTNNGLVVLKSTPDAVASLNVPESNTDSGRGRVELSEVKANQWYRLGVPVSDGTGVMLDAAEAGNWVYRSAKSWKKITTESEPVAPMEGIMVLYEADHVIDFEGTLNTGEITRTINYGKGYYLFSNPYPSAMKWDINDFATKGVSISDNLSATIYYRVYAGSQVGDYMITYNGFTGMSNVMTGAKTPAGYNLDNVGDIAPMQSVWVKVNDSQEATITVNNKARKEQNTMPLKNASSSSERSVLHLMQTNEFISDVTVLAFDDIFSDGLDRADSEKMFNGSKNVPEIYTRVEGKSLSINGLSALNGMPISIPVSVRNQIESEVTFSWDLTEFADNYNVFLEDKTTGSWINMREVSDFTYTPEEMGDNHDRFVLHLEAMQEVATSVARINSENVESIEVIGNNDNVIVRISAELLGSNDATIEVVDLNGRVIENVKTRATETQISLPAGIAVYVIKVIAEDAQKVTKVAGR